MVILWPACWKEVGWITLDGMISPLLYADIRDAGHQLFSLFCWTLEACESLPGFARHMAWRS